MTRPTRVCLGDTVLLADVGNTRIKLAVVSDHGRGGDGSQRLPVIDRRHDLDSRGFREENLEQGLKSAAPGSAVVLLASVHEAAATRLEAALAAVSATSHRSLRQQMKELPRGLEVLKVEALAPPANADGPPLPRAGSR